MCNSNVDIFLLPKINDMEKMFNIDLKKPNKQKNYTRA